MDEETLRTQTSEITECIQGLSLTLTEASNGSGVGKVIGDVLKLIQSFRLLGNYYSNELQKKCRELDMKDVQLKELACELEQLKSEGNACHSAGPEPGSSSDMHRQDVREEMCDIDHQKRAKHQGAFTDTVKDFGLHSKDSDESVKDPASFQGDEEEDEEEGSEEPLKDQAPVGKLAANTNILLQLLMMERKQIEDLLWHLTDANRTADFKLSTRPLSSNYEPDEIHMTCKDLGCKCAEEDKWTHLESILESIVRPPDSKSVGTQTYSLPFSSFAQIKHDKRSPVQVVHVV